MPSIAVDAILFDMDGTLIDDSRSYIECIRLSAEYILRSPVALAEVQEIKRLPGFNNDIDAAWALIGRHLHGHVLAPDGTDRASHAYRRLRGIFETYYLGHQLWTELSKTEAPFEWSEPLMLRETLLIEPETLEGLRGFKLGIATSRPRAEALLALTQHGLEQFFSPHLVVGAEDAPREKPHPAPLHELKRRVGCARPVYVGDTINDALAARAAGMPFIYVGRDDLSGRVAYRLEDVNRLSDLCALAGAV